LAENRFPARRGAWAFPARDGDDVVARSALIARSNQVTKKPPGVSTEGLPQFPLCSEESSEPSTYRAGKMASLEMVAVDLEFLPNSHEVVADA
jgi:hypothetical protein